MQYHPMSFHSSLSAQGNLYCAQYQNVGTLEVGSFGGNRPRLDSGTSLSSESSNTGKPPRRRSHRPRGCRGGSNRRRNKAGELSGEPKGCNWNGRERHESKTILAKHSKIKPCSSSKKGTTSKHVAVSSHSAHESNNRERSFSSSSVSTAPTSDFSSSHDVDDISFLNDYSTIQTSFSDSSSEKGVASTVVTGTSSQILPPLPLRKIQTQQFHSGRNPYALQNTNDVVSCASISKCHDLSHAVNGSMSSYATAVQSLNQQPIRNQHEYPMPSEHYGFDCCSIGVTAMNTAGNMGPPPPRHLLRMPVVSNMTVSTGNGRSIAAACTRESGHYTERLEIQRQVVEGGSLFLTSPRSFLMGKRNYFSKTASD